MTHLFRFPLLLAVLVCGIASATAQTGYRAHINLLHTSNDRVRVMVFPPAIAEDTATLVFPVTIPGTYETQNWWRLVHNVTAVDTGGKYLNVRRSNDSQFVIERARTIKAIGYEVDDTFDDMDSTVDLFHPSGSSFEGDSLFIVNHANVLGYLQGYQSREYHVEVQHGKHLYGASGMALTRISDTLDVYHAETYDVLVDNPIMYTRPDTSSFVAGGTRVMVSLAHSMSDTLARTYARSLKDVCMGIANFLPRMPVERYAFLLYLYSAGNTNVRPQGQMFGALEHSKSSIYMMPYSKTAGSLPQIAAHEFLHILMPLNLHSEEIEAFNFRAPKMSQHLWLYEGVTEYFSYLALLRNKGIKENEFLKEFEKKARGVDMLPPTFSFTDWSRNVLTPEGQKIYGMIYSYGAINAMLLDITMRESTGGEKGLLDLVNTLSIQYGQHRPFKDDELFLAIERATNGTVATYLKTYVQGTERIPMATTFAKIGWTYKEQDSVREYQYGFEPEMTQSGMKLKPAADNVLDIEAGDLLTHINGKSLDEAEQEDWQSLFSPGSAKAIKITVVRNGSATNLSGTARMMSHLRHHVLTADPHATPEQQALRAKVLYGK